MNINELIKKAHDNAVSKGFYDCEKCYGTGRECDNGPDCDRIDFKNDKSMCVEYCGNCCTYCEGTGKADKNIGELLMLIVSELGEALEAHRGDYFSNFDEYNHRVEILKKSGLSQDYSENLAFYEELSSSFEFELADACIRIFDLCGYLNIDLEKHIELKMKYNETREYKHGKKY